MTRFQVSNPLPSPNPACEYAFSCLKGQQARYFNAYKDLNILFTVAFDDCEVGGERMTLVHFYADRRF